jgi:hypothetical protein
MVPRATPFERNRPLGIPDVFDMPELQSECRATGSPHARLPAPSPLATAANAAAASASTAVGEQQDVSTKTLVVKIFGIETPIFNQISIVYRQFEKT